MKGIVIVTRQDLDNCPDIESSLRKFSESVEQDGDNVLFFSNEGALMTMICQLLDKEVKYTLQFDQAAQSSPAGTGNFSRVSSD